MGATNMAIIIPSAKTYDRQNPKIRDNVIERIEVGAVEVVPDNEYDALVSNKTITNMIEGSNYLGEGFTVSYNYNRNPNPKDNSDYQYFMTLLVGYQNITAISKKFEFYVPKKAKATHIIQKLKSLTEEISKEDNTKEIIPKINFSITANKYIGTGTMYAEIGSSFNDLSADKVTIVTPAQRIFNTQPTNTRVDILKLEIDINRTAGGQGDYPVVTQNLRWVYGGSLPAQQNGTISAIIEEDEEGFTIKTEIVCGAYLDSYSTSQTTGAYSTGGTHPFDGALYLSGSSVWYEPVSVEFTLYGDTIGIDLVDKTVYINGQTAKKVHSIDGNELMQTSNYYSVKGTKAIEKMYGNTQKQYANGKETAVIRCSIGDYYDGARRKIIDISDTTKPMKFSIGDEVMPMVYGADGKDYPMSLYKDGTQKVFTVLMTKPYYDGAVWQELTLQEKYKEL